MVLVLYSHVWRLTFQNPILYTFSPLLTPTFLKPLNVAIQNWKLYWDDLKSTLQSQQWNKLGFERSAESYWNLTRAVFCAFEKGMGVVASNPGNNSSSGVTAPGAAVVSGPGAIVSGANGSTAMATLPSGGFLPIEGDCELGIHLKKLLFGSS